MTDRAEVGTQFEQRIGSFSDSLTPDSCPLTHGSCSLTPDSCPTTDSWIGARLGIGLLVAGQSMIFGLALNLHEDVPSDVRWFAQNIMFGATLLVVALLGGPLFRTAWQELRRGRLTLEALFLLTMTGAMAASLQAHISGHGKIYFEVISVLLVVYTLGKVIGARSRAAALAGTRSWAQRLSTCRRIDDRGRMQTVPVGEIFPGDVIEVWPGETIAIDGVIREGSGFVSEAPVSGEPFAAVKRSGDKLLAGAASYDATFRIEATAKGTDRQVDQILAVVEQARTRPTSFQGQADRIGRFIFPLIVLTAVGTFTYWTFFTQSGWEAGLFNAMSVLLVACPCAIGLATPIVIWSALGKLAERGLIVREGDAVERLAEIDCVFLDKTGTLTDDSLTLIDIATFSTDSDRAELLGWLAMIQERSRHPIAKAFARLPRPSHHNQESRIVSYTVVAGCGVEAEIEDTLGIHHAIQIGTPEWICKAGSARDELLGRLRTEGHQVAVNIDGNLAAIAVLSEQLRESAQEAIAGFQQLGLAVEVLTGDRTRPLLSAVSPHPPTPSPRGRGGEDLLPLSPGERGLGGEGFSGLGGEGHLRMRANQMGEDLLPLSPEERGLGGEGLPQRGEGDMSVLPSVHSGLLPADKLAIVEDMKAGGSRPLFVGDGINDAAALAAAHVGIALSSGAEIAQGAAAITLTHHDLRVLPWGIELSRQAVRAVRRNLYRALLYNLVSIWLAAGGVLHPIVAALLMVVSSLTLIFSASRVSNAREHCQTSGRREPLVQVNSSRGQKSFARRAFGHGLAFVLQGLVFLLLLDSARDLPAISLLVTTFAGAGLGMGYIWYRWSTIPHAVDMCVGMLTFGNLGMLLGWWADNGFSPLVDGGCSACVASMRDGLLQPWMWLGMLAGANAAMLWFRRCETLPGRSHTIAMFTGGNMGMIAGMLMGGWCAAQITTASVSTAVTLSYVSMTAGMVTWMLVGTWLVEKAIRILGSLIPALISVGQAGLHLEEI